MNSQHSALNKNLGNAAKQILDITHSDHKQIAEKLQTNLKATHAAIDKLQKDSSKSFKQAFNDFTEKQLKGGKNAGSLFEQVQQLSLEAQASMQKLGKAAKA